MTTVPYQRWTESNEYWNKTGYGYLPSRQWMSYTPPTTAMTAVCRLGKIKQIINTLLCYMRYSCKCENNAFSNYKRTTRTIMVTLRNLLIGSKRKLKLSGKTVSTHFIV